MAILGREQSITASRFLPFSAVDHRTQRLSPFAATVPFLDSPAPDNGVAMGAGRIARSLLHFRHSNQSLDDGSNMESNNEA